MTAYKPYYDLIVKPMKPGEYWLTKDIALKLFNSMLGEKPLPAIPPANAVAPVTRDIPPERWEQIWKNMPHNVRGKPEVVEAADALEACICYGIEIKMIWDRLKTYNDLWETEKKARALLPAPLLEKNLVDSYTNGMFHDIILVNVHTKAHYK